MQMFATIFMKCCFLTFSSVVDLLHRCGSPCLFFAFVILCCCCFWVVPAGFSVQNSNEIFGILQNSELELRNSNRRATGRQRSNVKHGLWHAPTPCTTAGKTHSATSLTNEVKTSLSSNDACSFVANLTTISHNLMEGPATCQSERKC